METISDALFYCTFCVSIAEVLPENFESPPYAALIECAPLVKVEMVNVADALEFREPVPKVVLPSLNVTVPVGVPDVAGLTLAVNVTLWPNVEGLIEEVSVVVEPALFTVCVSTGDVLPVKFALPPYTAVTE